MFSDAIYSVGGVTNGDKRCDSMECFNISSNQSTFMPSMSTRRGLCAGATLNGSFYVCGKQMLQLSTARFAYCGPNLRCSRVKRHCDAGLPPET